MENWRRGVTVSAFFHEKIISLDVQIWLAEAEPAQVRERNREIFRLNVYLI